MKKISVVVPVYNASRYLERCIESILNQNYREIELLLVDNGSTDNSLEICKKYEMADQRVRVFTEIKKGPSCARNKGIKEMTGEYLAFVDSDDYVENDMYSYLVCLLEQNNSQMVVGSWFKRMENNTKKIAEDVGVHGTITISSESAKSVIAAEDIIYGGGFPWNRIINWEYVKKKHILLFDENLIVYEDKLWVVKLLDYIEKVTISDYCGYNYVIRENSISHSAISTLKCKQFIYAWGEIYDLCKHCMNNNINFHYCDSIMRMIFFMYRNKDLDCTFKYWNEYKYLFSPKMLLHNPKNIIKWLVLFLGCLIYRGGK